MPQLIQVKAYMIYGHLEIIMHFHSLITVLQIQLSCFYFWFINNYKNYCAISFIKTVLKFSLA